MDPIKIKAITDYLQSANVKSLQSLLGLVNFSLRFVPQLATVASLTQEGHIILLVQGLHREFTTNQTNHSRSCPISIPGFQQDISPTNGRIKYRNWFCFATARSLRRLVTYRLHQSSSHKGRTEPLNYNKGILGSGLGLPKISPIFAWNHNLGKNRPSTLSIIDTQEPSTGSSIVLGISITSVQIHHDLQTWHH